MKIIFRILKFAIGLFVAGLVASILIGVNLAIRGPGWGETKIMDYKEYSAQYQRIAIPTSSKNIKRFSLSQFDANYEVIHATVDESDVDLKKIVRMCKLFEGKNIVEAENIPSALSHFTTEGNLPRWLIGIDPDNFTKNYVKAGNDNKYGEDEGYGYGCWAFYNQDKKFLLVRRWSQQHLSLKAFKSIYNIPDNPDQPPDTNGEPAATSSP